MKVSEEQCTRIQLDADEYLSLIRNGHVRDGPTEIYVTEKEMVRALAELDDINDV